MMMMVIDNDDDDGDNNDYPLRSASSSLSFFCGVLSLASSSKDGVVCYYQSCNCQIICFFFHRTRDLHSTSWCQKYFSPPPSANANQTEVLSKFLIDWLKHSTFGSIVFLAMFLQYQLLIFNLLTGKIRGLLPYQPVYSSELSAKLGLQVERKERRVRIILEYSNIFKQIILKNNVKLKGRREG